VRITDAAGRLVYKTTSNGGTATWNGKTMTGAPVATGVYFIWSATNENLTSKDRKVGKVVVVR
jgi:flagellar hook assembly protein FlgD